MTTVRERVETVIYQGPLVVVVRYATGEWGLPGGGLDGDDLLVAAVKETREELGLLVVDPQAIDHPPFRRVWDKAATPKQAARQASHHGSRTTYVRARYMGFCDSAESVEERGFDLVRWVHLKDADQYLNTERGAHRLAAVRAAFNNQKEA